MEDRRGTHQRRRRALGMDRPGVRGRLLSRSRECSPPRLAGDRARSPGDRRGEEARPERRARRGEAQGSAGRPQRFRREDRWRHLSGEAERNEGRAHSKGRERTRTRPCAAVVAEGDALVVGCGNVLVSDIRSPQLPRRHDRRLRSEHRRKRTYQRIGRIREARQDRAEADERGPQVRLHGRDNRSAHTRSR